MKVVVAVDSFKGSMRSDEAGRIIAAGLREALGDHEIVTIPIADGGEVVIYAPHITEVSYVHGHHLDQIGYHVRDYFTAQWEKFEHIPWGVLAHSTHLRGAGTYVAGVEESRIRVTLATGIPRGRCEAIGLGYLDPALVEIEEWADREDEGVLLVRRAGEQLYRLKKSDTP
mgnify:CR=1 FL=1